MTRELSVYMWGYVKADASGLVHWSDITQDPLLVSMSASDVSRFKSFKGSAQFVWLFEWMLDRGYAHVNLVSGVLTIWSTIDRSTLAGKIKTLFSTTPTLAMNTDWVIMRGWHDGSDARRSVKEFL